MSLFSALEFDVLRALLRLARRRTPPTLDQLVVRVGGEAPEVKTALRTLARMGLVQRTPHGIGLTLEGLAVSVAYAKRAPERSGVTAAKTKKPAKERRAA
jgi:DNA-binding IclR family transcriptional regulator